MSAKSNSRTKSVARNNQKGLIPAERGFVPCFNRYNHDRYPIEKAYRNGVFINHVAVLLSVMLTTVNICDVRKRGGCHNIRKLIPNSRETKSLIREFNNAQDLSLYRLKYGDNKMRVVLGIKDSTRECFILALDADHTTLNGKKK